MVLKTRLLYGFGVAVAAIGLFFAYLRMAYAFPINSDGASNAMQAWDMFHGNPLLSDWTLSDVAFYPTELIQYAMVQVFTGPTVAQTTSSSSCTATGARPTRSHSTAPTPRSSSAARSSCC